MLETKKSLELSLLLNTVPDRVRLLWLIVRVELSKILEMCCNSTLQGYAL